MNRDQIIDLLTLMASFDRRTVGNADVDSWQMAVGDLASADAQLAVVAHYRETSDWLMPADLRKLVKRLRADRLASSDLVVPAADPRDTKAYIAALKSNLRDLGDGRPPLRAIGAGPGEANPRGQSAVRDVIAEFQARQDAAAERHRVEREAEREALAVYLEASGLLLRQGVDATAEWVAAAEQALFGPEQAKAGFPLAADSLGMTDTQRTTIYAAELARRDGAV